MKKKVLVSIVSFLAIALFSIIKTNFKIHSNFFRFDCMNCFVKNLTYNQIYSYQYDINYAEINS